MKSKDNKKIGKYATREDEPRCCPSLEFYEKVVHFSL